MRGAAVPCNPGAAGPGTVVFVGESRGPEPGPAIAPPPLPGLRRALLFWRSPPGQPGWARPALLAVTALAVVGYAWAIGSINLEPFYGAAARSMSESWHNFLFGAVDPWATVSVDKLPGALWFQALSLRLFGFHLWAIVLPQVIEGALTVLVLFRAVRRVAGPFAGLVAALVLAVSPITVLLNRGNISDSLLILLLVLSADATTRAIAEGRPRSLLLAGAWVGLAFQAKMLQAWLILPALFLAYLVAAPASALLRRVGHVVLCSLVVAVVSLSWMTAVSAVPTHDRPYVDGSCQDSLYSQVFVYNGLDRFGATEVHQRGCSRPSRFLVEAGKIGAASGLGTASVPAGWARLLRGVFGRDDGWVLVPAVVAAAGLLVLTRRRPRTDALRAATLLWTGWLVLTWAFFSSGRYLNSYYLAALIPALAALCGLGAGVAWPLRHRVRIRLVVLVTVVASTVYAITLLPRYVGVRSWIIAWLVIVAVLAAGILAASLRHGHRSVWTISCGLGLAFLALVSSSVWASGSVLVAGEGPFDTPYQPARVTFDSQVYPGRVRAVVWPELVAYANTVPPTRAADVFESSFRAGYYIFATGREFLPVGGFSGEVPAPSLSQLIRYVASGRIGQATAAVSPRSNNPDMVWIIRHCQAQQSPGATFIDSGTRMQRFSCTPADAR